MKYYTHVNRGVIDSNRKNGRDAPPVKFQRGKRGPATYAHEVEFTGGGRIVYDSNGKLLPCGARLVIVTDEEPKVIR